jgi:hypothetical protein
MVENCFGAGFMREAETDFRWWHGVALIGLLGWLFFSLAAYYVVQRPFDAATIQAIQQVGWGEFAFSGAALGRSLLDVLAALWLAVVALGLGLWLWRWLGPDEGEALEALLFSWGMGFGALGLLVLFVGLVGWLQRPFLLSLTIILTLVGLPVLLPFLRTVNLGKRPSPLVTFYLLVVTGLAFTVSLLPPTSWDSLSYHLRGPWLYLQAGRIYPELDLFSLNYPFLLEMIFLLSMAIRSDATAQLSHFFFLFLLAGMVYQTAVGGLKLKQGWTAVLLLFATPMVLVLAPTTYNDLALAFATLAALYAFARWQEPAQLRWLILSGVFSGLAMSLKYTSFLLPTVLGFWLIWQNWRQPQKLLRLLFAFALPILLVAGVWYIKNWLLTGNPVYPFAFGGREWDEFQANAHRIPGSGIGLNVWAIFTIPYTLTLGIVDSGNDGTLGPLYLALLPLLLFYTFKRFWQTAPKLLNLLLLYVLVHYIFWVIGVIDSAPLWQGRLMLPALAALCPILAWMLADLDRFDHPQFSLQRFLNLVLAIVLLFGLIRQLGDWLALNPLAYVVGDQSRAAYLERNLGTLYPVSVEISEMLPPDAAVQFLWEPRTYYCELDCRGDHILDKYSHLEHLHGSAEGIARALAAEGVTHLLVFEHGLTFLLDNEAEWVVPADFAEYERFISTYTRSVQQWGDAYSLLKLQYNE